MGGSIEYHLAKADYQCRRALSKLSRDGNPLMTDVGHAIAAIRTVRKALTAQAEAAAAAPKST